MRYRRRRNKKQRKIIIVSMCSLLLFMTIGYAAMQTNLEIKAKGNVVKKATGAETLIDNVDIITSGDGLYKDSYEDNVYTYRGSNPNNYVNFNNELWRIISINIESNTIKIIRNDIINYDYFDTENNGRYQGSSGYCNLSGYGCNIWGSNTTLYDNSGKNITMLDRYYNGYSNNKYRLPSKEAELNLSLNSTYYSSIEILSKSMVIDGIYKVGVLGMISGQSTNTDLQQTSSVKWKGKVALIDATEYVRASTNSSCTGAYAYFNSNSCYNGGGDNWLFNEDYWWTLSPLSYNAYAFSIWRIRNNGSMNGESNVTQGVRPVVTLSPEVEITGGDGSENNPFQLSL